MSGGIWSALHPARFIVSSPPVAPVAGDLVISELHYHPPPPTTGELAILPTVIDEDFEFIELMNITSQPLRLDGCVFSDGIDFIFPEDSILQPDARLVLVKNKEAFALRYSSLVDGNYSGKLSNSGERIALDSATGVNLIDFTYGDGSGTITPDAPLWPTAPDGSGESLVLIHPAWGANPNNPLLWRSSVSPDGTPGGSDARTLPDNLNEDIDGDGSIALLELTLATSDTDPAQFPRIEPVIKQIPDGSVAPPSYLTIEFTRDALVEAAIDVLTSTDLNLWSDNAILLSRHIHTDGTETLQYRFPTPQAGSPQFIRIRVSH